MDPTPDQQRGKQPGMSGRKIGQYEFVEKVGIGGMGEVYRARDTELGRDVAVKVLREKALRNPTGLSRFRREAHVLASINHPNIASAYGLLNEDGLNCLVMEYVPGDTLGKLLRTRRPEPRDVLDIGRQIALALEAAHEKGLIHRDLKPENVKITPDGTVKVLDFGVAKLIESPTQAEEETTESPTVTMATMEGQVVGTPAYMSPEQARGKKLDERTDIWSFGCLLFELLSGTQLFPGETNTDSLALVLRQEPDWQTLPASIPPKVIDMLRRCLQKDPRRRLHHIADARIVLEEALEEGLATPQGAAAAVVSRNWMWVAGAALLAALAAIGWAVWLRPAGPAHAPVAVMIDPGGALQLVFLPAATISPDGQHVVFAAARSGRSLLYSRHVSRFDVTVLADSEGAAGPFFSPGGDEVGFFAGGKLKRISLGRGAPMTLADAPNGRGGAWGPDGTIVFAPTNLGGLYKIRAGGGTPEPLTRLDPSKKERSHRLPQFLPDGKTVLFTVEVTGAIFDEARIEAVDVATGKRTPVWEGGYSPQYSPTGHLLFARAEGVYAIPFDPGTKRTEGSPMLALPEVQHNPVTGSAQFCVSGSGAIVYAPSVALAEGSLLFTDRGGVSRPLSDVRRGYYAPSLSPDGKTLAISAAHGSNRDIWLFDMVRGGLTRLTFESALDAYPLWTPDASRVAYSSSRAGARNLFWITADGSGHPQRLTTSSNTQLPGGFTPDGQTLVFEESDPTTSWDIWRLAINNGAPGKPEPLLQTQFAESAPRLSPNGRWLSYVSDESGRAEVYLRAYPEMNGKRQVSNGGGSQPLWARNGRELYYRQLDRVIAVPLDNGIPGTSRLLFAGEFDQGPGSGNYDVTPDGRGFITVRGSDPVWGGPQLNLVLHWKPELQKEAGKP